MDLNTAAAVQAMLIDSSTSSSSDSDEELLDLILSDEEGINENERRPRVELFVETVIYRYSEKEFQENYRMKRVTFYYVLWLIKPQLEGDLNQSGRQPISPEKQLFIALYVLGTPDSYRSVTTKFDIGKATAWRSVLRVVKALCTFKNYFIKWPSQIEALNTCRRIEDKFNFPNVVGAIDGTHIQIAAPKKDSQSYINRKNVHSIQLMVICNDKLEFIYCYTGLPGSVHDMRVFRYSGFQGYCNEEFFPDNCILGDSAYTIQKHIMVPYRDDGHLTVEQTHFNTVLSKTRMMVERSIGLLKCRWRYLIEKLPMRRTDLIPYYILSCCILHNICLRKEDEFEHPVVIEDVNDMEPAPFMLDNVLQQEGERKRDAICHFLNRNL